MPSTPLLADETIFGLPPILQRPAPTPLPPSPALLLLIFSLTHPLSVLATPYSSAICPGTVSLPAGRGRFREALLPHPPIRCPWYSTLLRETTTLRSLLAMLPEATPWP